MRTPNAPTPLLSGSAGGFEKLDAPVGRAPLLAEDVLLLEELAGEVLFVPADVSGFDVFTDEDEVSAPEAELPEVLDDEKELDGRDEDEEAGPFSVAFDPVEPAPAAFFEAPEDGDELVCSVDEPFGVVFSLTFSGFKSIVTGRLEPEVDEPVAELPGFPEAPEPVLSDDEVPPGDFLSAAIYFLLNPASLKIFTIHTSLGSGTAAAMCLALQYNDSPGSG